MISVAALIAAGIGPTQAKTFIEPIEQTCERFQINTPQREAAFISQCAHESSRFIRLEEGLFYRDPEWIIKVFPSSVKTLLEAKSLVGNPKGLANTVYANKNGNGGYNSGDGYRYRGRGLIQLTGRANYTAAGLELHEPYIDHPDIVSSPPDAALTAGWFWDRHRCNELADASDIDGITRAINGSAMLGAEDRRNLYSRFLNAFR